MIQEKIYFDVGRNKNKDRRNVTEYGTLNMT